MLRKPIPKIKNPQYGAYSLRYRGNKGVFVGAISKAKSFQYLKADKSFSVPIKIPTAIKTAYEKKLFIYYVLAKIISGSETRKEKAAIRKGKKYEKRIPEEVLKIEGSDLEILRAEFPDVFPRPDKEYLVLDNTEDFKQKIIRSKPVLRKLGTTIYANMFKAQTNGRSTPNISGESLDWVAIQKEIGLIKEKEVIQQYKRNGKIYKRKKTILTGDGSILYFFTREVRRFFHSDDFKKILRKQTKTTKGMGFKLAVLTSLEIQPDIMISTEVFYLPMRLSKKVFKKRVDGICWRMAKECLRLLNDDMPSDETDDVKRHLTSDDIVTKARWTPELGQDFECAIGIVEVGTRTIPSWVLKNKQKYLGDLDD